VLEGLHQFGHYCMAEKYPFGATTIGFLTSIICSDMVVMESDRISTIEDWCIPKSIRKVYVLLRFTDFYRQFSCKYVMETTPISESLKNLPGEREYTRMAELTFQKLKTAFTEAVMHQHFDPARSIVIQMDASSFICASILNQSDCFRILRQANIFSPKCSAAEQIYEKYDLELLAIMETLRNCKYYLVGANHKILIQCDDQNQESFQTSKVVFWRHARCSDIL